MKTHSVRPLFQADWGESVAADVRRSTPRSTGNGGHQHIRSCWRRRATGQIGQMKGCYSGGDPSWHLVFCRQGVSMLVICLPSEFATRVESCRDLMGVLVFGS